jgi:hypothetical protein
VELMSGHPMTAPADRCPRCGYAGRERNDPELDSLDDREIDWRGRWFADRLTADRQHAALELRIAAAEAEALASQALLREVVAALDDPTSDTACPTDVERRIREHLAGKP